MRVFVILLINNDAANIKTFVTLVTYNLRFYCIYIFNQIRQLYLKDVTLIFKIIFSVIIYIKCIFKNHDYC